MDWEIGGSGCFEKCLIHLGGVDVVGGVVFVLPFMKEEYGFGGGVVYACMEGCLYGMLSTSWIDFCSAMARLRKIYFCCLVTF